MKVSHAFYKVSKILSIVFLILAIIGTIGIAICFGSILAKNSFPISIGGDLYTREQIQSMLIYVIVFGVISISFLIANLIVSVKAMKENKNGLHITAIVFGVLSGVIFDIPAAIIALNENKKQSSEVKKE